MWSFQHYILKLPDRYKTNAALSDDIFIMSLKTCGFGESQINFEIISPVFEKADQEREQLEDVGGSTGLKEFYWSPTTICKLNISIGYVHLLNLKFLNLSIWLTLFFFCILTVRCNGFPEAAHPLGHWVEAKYDQSGKLIRAPRGTFPHFEELQNSVATGKRLPKTYWKTWMKICTLMSEVEVRIISRHFWLFGLSGFQHVLKFSKTFSRTRSKTKYTTMATCVNTLRRSRGTLSSQTFRRSIDLLENTRARRRVVWKRYNYRKQIWRNKSKDNIFELEKFRLHIFIRMHYFSNIKLQCKVN